jgi:tRNA nucleotidyltransferase (CCA-adding enzyme)
VQIAVGHANPDFDAYASTVAATKLFPGAKGVFLGTQNANVRAFHNLHEDFLDFADLKGLDLAEVERLIMVDTRDPDRIAEFKEVAEDPNVEVIVYDHHPPAEGDLATADDRSLPVGATTSILVHEIRRQGIPLTPLEASVMLLGIHEDTGSLTYPGSTAFDAEAAAFLMGAGAELEVVNEFLARALDARQRDLLDQLTGSLTVWDINGQDIAVGVARTDDYVDSAGVLTHYVVEDMGFRAAVAVVSMPDRVQIVGRSRLPEIDIGAVMGRLGGGGHAQAASAGFREITEEEALQRVHDALEAEVRPPLSAADIATRPVRTVSPDASMTEAGELMRQWGHGGLPVVEDGHLVGIITRKDVDKAERHGLAHAPVKGFTNRDPICVGPRADLGELERLLAQRGIGRVPVMDDGRLIGIVTRKDVLRAQHGDAYLDRRVPQQRTEASERFLENLEALLPGEALGALRSVGELAEDFGVRAHVVGGFVRDMLLGKPNLDMDVVVEGDGVAFAEAAAQHLGARVKVHRRFGTAVLVLSRTLHVDVTSARTEYYTRPGALPTVERSSLRQDLFRRDFTINAMAACINSECFGAIADPFGGLRDLERRIVRVLHALSFIEDPTRVLRAARFERRYGFSMDRATDELARRAVDMGMLEEVSGARLREEMLDIVDEESCVAVFERLDDLGALALLLPTDVTAPDALAHLAAAESAHRHLRPMQPRQPRRRVTLLASLALGASPESAERWLRHVRLGKEYGESVLQVARRLPTVLRALGDRRQMPPSRLYHLLQPLTPEALVVTWSATVAHGRERIETYLHDLRGLRPAVDGEDLITMGGRPSEAFAIVLARALDDRLDGIAVGRDAELDNLRRLAVQAGIVAPAEAPRAGRGSEGVTE